ncbi:MAG: alanine--tRNA ligase [Oscillospiraceae bacterium]|nr:alanine--tRNA ligase [Oscillospiraceae bacterium]
MRDIKYFGANELRTKFFEFFKSKNHVVLESFPLIPINDKSLLIINSGMAPMKPYFLGEKIPPAKRVVTCQKCVRVIDIEDVGIKSRYCTFFEMLGNFSFGDYFKKETLAWMWEFLTKELEIPEDLLFPSVYFEDDEAFDIWVNDIGLPPEKITRLGKEDNFWEAGPTGPCGPCSEIYFDRGEQYGCDNPGCKPGCDCDRFIEICNNVFTQFDNDGKGNYIPLKQKNIDMGMGLERLSMVMQQVDSLQEIDTFRVIINKICEIAGIKYNSNEKDGVSVRIIADHIRSSTFMICDNIMPSNEGRGYVLRRLLRRAARHGKLLGIKGAFLYDLTDKVIDSSKEAYPELEQKREYIKRVLKSEEDRFETTINSGLEILETMIKKAKENKLDELSGENIFKLYDTYGFPYDLIHEIAEEHKLALGKEGFEKLMQEQITRAREARANIEGWIKDRLAGFMQNISITKFDGYSVLTERSKIVSIIVEDGENFAAADSINEGEFTLILDKTPFYAESGGQVGDIGIIKTNSATALVSDCRKTADGKIIHICKIEDGELKIGEEVEASVDVITRLATARNHSAAHLLQAALRKVLGSHIEQAGSYVDSERVRFDFTHFAAMSEEEIEEVENIVNENILAALDVTVVETDIESAKKMGAIALFDDKYGDKVRVVKMGNVSCELCGGTHLDNTSKAGLFKIISESSVAAGVRRIEGTTGRGVLDIIKKYKDLIVGTAGILKANNPNDIAKRAEVLTGELREARREIESLTAEIAHGKTNKLLSEAKKIDGCDIEYFSAVMGNTTPDEVKMICEELKQRNQNIVAVIVSTGENKIVFTAVCGSEAVKSGANAGNLVRQIAQIAGGSGGGRPEFAVAGGKDRSKVAEALEKGEEILRSMLKK